MKRLVRQPRLIAFSIALITCLFLLSQSSLAAVAAASVTEFSPAILPRGITAGPDGNLWFAQYQPFTPVIDTLRRLPIGNSAILTVTWCIVLALVGYLWAQAVYNRNSTR